MKIHEKFRYPSLFFVTSLALCALFQDARVLSTETSVFTGKIEIHLLPASFLLLKCYAEKEGGKGNVLLHQLHFVLLYFPLCFQKPRDWVQHHLLGKGGDYPTLLCAGATSI